MALGVSLGINAPQISPLYVVRSQCENMPSRVNNVKTEETLKRWKITLEMIFFETNTSVFELLWDVALSLLIIRVAFLYFELHSGLHSSRKHRANLQPQ
jgi:hypothetical protein